jgi:hypothetical protein
MLVGLVAPGAVLAIVFVAGELEREQLLLVDDDHITIWTGSDLIPRRKFE